MSRYVLTDTEIEDLRMLHPDIDEKVSEHYAMFAAPGHLYRWDQILIAGQGDRIGNTEVPIPPRGIAFNDSAYGEVILYPDARGQLHWINFTDPTAQEQQVAAEIQKPVYSSDPDYWQLFDDWSRHLLPTIPELKLGILILASVAIFAFVRS